VVKTPSPDFLALLRTLLEHKVDFIVVGGVCGVLHGAPFSTFDLDIVHSREAGNLERLRKALEALGARYRTPGHKNVKPSRSHLSSPGHQLLMTTAGPLDLLGTIGKGRAYHDLLGETTELDLDEGWRVRLLDLAALIRIKAETAQEKDKAQLAVLRRTLEEQRKR
jgi:predicted nucleotidyltransferase